MKHVLPLLLFLFGAQAVSAQTPPVPEAPYGLDAPSVYAIFQSEYSNVMRPGTPKTPENFDLLLMYGRWLLVAHPKTLRLPGNAEYRGDRTFDRMINAYVAIAGDMADPVAKSTYLDSANALYNKVFEIFTPEEIDEFRWRFDYGRFLLSNTGIADNANKALAQYQILFAKDPARVTKEADGFYVQYIASQLERNGENDAALTFMDTAEPHADATTVRFFNDIRDRLLRNPEDRIPVLEDRLSKNPGDTEVMGQLYDLYVRVNDRDKARAMAESLFNLEANYMNTRRMGAIAASNANYARSNEFLIQALGKTEEPNEQKQVAMEIAENFKNLDNLRQARDYARRASSLDPNWGAPYLKLAEIYGQAVTDCAGGQLTRMDKVVYWLVLDYLDKARADQSLRASIDRIYSTYERSAPSVEEKFYQNWSPGDRIQVNASLKDCYGWINESTRVR